MMIIGFPHRPPPSGGPGTFQTRLSKRLEAEGNLLAYPEDRIVPDVILVVGGTRKIFWLWRMKKKGVRIVHRLDGLNWRHRKMGCHWTHYLKSEFRNWLMTIIRNRLADEVVYQSEFIKKWWHEEHGSSGCEEHIIWNGTDLSLFAPKRNKLDGIVRLICVEGTVQGDDITLGILTTVTQALVEKGLIAETVVYGEYDEATKYKLRNFECIKLMGRIGRDQMPEAFQNGDIYFALELNPPCPNSVVEALSSGLPVIGYDTGALGELVAGRAGKIVPYSASPWDLEMPASDKLIAEAEILIANLSDYSRAARELAIERYGDEKMHQKYMSILKD